MSDDIQRVANSFKEQTKNLSQEAVQAYFKKQSEEYERQYNSFLGHYQKDECYLCGKSISTISKKNPCLHWLLRRCKFKKKDFYTVYEMFDFYAVSAYLRWVSSVETGSRNINNLKEESSDRKLFEATIKWKNIEWTLDCSHNDYKGHEGTKTDYPHWHFQMRIDGHQFINFSDFHIPFSKDDQLKLVLENDPESGFAHSFGYGGQGMQERMDQLSENPDEFIANAMHASDPDDGSIHMQSMIMAGDDGISGEQIDEAMNMYRETGKTLNYCFKKVLESEPDVSIKTIVSPAESVPKIAKRTERKRR